MNNYTQEDDAARWPQYNSFFGLVLQSSTPTPHSDEPPQTFFTIDKLELLHIFAMQDVNKEEVEYDLGHFRNDTAWVFSLWPSVSAPPKQVIPLTNEQLLLLFQRVVDPY